MPCRDSRDDECKNELVKHADFLEAALCAVWQIFKDQGASDDEIMQNIDYEEAGISEKELRTWRQKHLKKDKERRLQEKEQMMKNIKNKLSKEELKLLGIK